MSKRRVDISSDEELLELFGDDPEGLAVLDAIRATQPAKRRVRRVVLLAAAALVLAVSAALFVNGTSKASVAKRALAAIDFAPVVHVRLVDDREAAMVVDLASGRTSQVHHVIDEWYAPASHRRRIRDSFLGAAVTDSAAPGPGRTSSDIAAILTDYREALTQRSVSTSGPASIAGKRVYVLTFSQGKNNLVRVTIDGSSYRPLNIEFDTGATFTVAQLQESQVGELVTEKPQDRTRPSSVRSARSTSLDEAVAVTGIPLRLPGLVAKSARKLVVKDETQPQTSEATEIAFAAVGRSTGLRVTVSDQPFRALGWNNAYLNLNSGVLLAHAGSPRRGFAEIGGSYVVFESSVGLQPMVKAAQAIRLRRAS